MGVLQRVRRMPTGNIVLVFVVVQALCILAGILFPVSFRYLELSNLQLLLRSIPPIAILSVGVGILMICGEFDLSVGSNYALSAYVMASLYNLGLPAVPAIVMGLAVGTVIGFLNGVVTLRARIPSFITTLGSMMVWRGVVLFVSGMQTAPFRPGPVTAALLAGNLGPVQAQFVWALGVAFAGYLLLERHKVGNHIFAVGGNAEAARAIGVDVGRVKLIAFTLAGTLAALAGIISSARVSSVSPELGKGLELQAIAACVVGGVSLAGGQGTILGLFLGSALLFTIQDVLLLLHAPGEYLDFFVGILIVLAVVFNRLTRKE